MNGLTACVPALDPRLRDPLWNLRRAAMPLLYGMPGDRKPVTFVEDAAVAPERLPEFVARFREILRTPRHRRRVLRPRQRRLPAHPPGAEPARPDDVAQMRRITEDVTDLVLEFGGSLSGEHGDGLARSEWNRKMFGPVVYDAFRQVKRAFDPHNLLNPGKVVDAPAMTENLRYAPRLSAQPSRHGFRLLASRKASFRSIEMCNGAGVCRKTQGGTMCPSFRATRDEKDSTRGRANALRLALVGESSAIANGDDEEESDSIRSPLERRWVYDVLDLCLMCKACKTECPSNVDMAKLKAEFLHLYYQPPHAAAGPRLDGEHASTSIAWASTCCAAGQLDCRRNRTGCAGCWRMVAGIDRRRSPARYCRRSFSQLVQSPAATRDRCNPAEGHPARRLLHHLQRAEHRPGGGAGAGSRGVPGRAGGHLLRPGPDQQGLSARGTRTGL